MFKWLLVTALAVSLAFCAWCEYDSLRKLREMRAEIARARADLEPLHAMYAEVHEYEKQKDKLQKRIDMINQLKQNQKVAADAVAKLSGVDAAGIESAAVVNGNLVINRQ